MRCTMGVFHQDTSADSATDPPTHVFPREHIAFKLSRQNLHAGGLTTPFGLGPRIKAVSGIAPPFMMAIMRAPRRALRRCHAIAERDRHRSGRL